MGLARNASALSGVVVLGPEPEGCLAQVPSRFLREEPVSAAESATVEVAAESTVEVAAAAEERPVVVTGLARASE
jgi:hypothetical protein